MKTPTLGSLARKEARWAYFFISPWIIGFIIFTLGPMIVSLYLSFTDYSLGSSISWPTFTGLENYIKLFTQDPKFWHSLGVTVTYAIIAVPLTLFFGFMVAFLLNLKVPGLAVWRTLYYLPSVTPAVAGAILWGIIFNPSFGIMNWFLSLIEHKRTGLVVQPAMGSPGIDHHEPVGGGRRYDHLSGRFTGHPYYALRSCRNRRGQFPQEINPYHTTVDDPGYLLQPGDRHHRDISIFYRSLRSNTRRSG